MTFSPRVSGYSCASGGALPLSGGCFKARFDVPPGEDFVEVRIPFSDFTDHWSSATGEPTTTFKFEQTNDPVMGGISSGSWSVNDAEGYGIEEGTVRDVPSLHAPGFITAGARGIF